MTTFLAQNYPFGPLGPQFDLTGLSIYDVKLYGAIGDGTTDDTAAIKAAVAAIPSSVGGVLYFPAGTYLTGVFTPYINNLVITGAGPGASTLLRNGSGSGAIIGCYAVSGVPTSILTNVRVRDLTFDGNSSGGKTGTNFVDFSIPMNNVWVEDCTFQNNNGHRDLWFGHTPQFGNTVNNGAVQISTFTIPDVGQTSTLTWTSSISPPSQYGIYANLSYVLGKEDDTGTTGGYYALVTAVTQNTSTQWTLTFQTVSLGQTSVGATIPPTSHWNVLTYSTGCGLRGIQILNHSNSGSVDLEACGLYCHQGLNVSGCYVSGHTCNGAGNAPPFFLYGYNHDCIITGNTFENANAAVSIQNGWDCLITNNVVHSGTNNQHKAFTIHNAKGIVIANNYVYGSGANSEGVKILDSTAVFDGNANMIENSFDCLITGNVFDNCDIGVLFSAFDNGLSGNQAFSNFTVSNNVFRNVHTSMIRLGNSSYSTSGSNGITGIRLNDNSLEEPGVGAIAGNSVGIELYGNPTGTITDLEVRRNRIMGTGSGVKIQYITTTALTDNDFSGCSSPVTLQNGALLAYAVRNKNFNPRGAADSTYPNPAVPASGGSGYTNAFPQDANVYITAGSQPVTVSLRGLNSQTVAAVVIAATDTQNVFIPVQMNVVIAYSLSGVAAATGTCTVGGTYATNDTLTTTINGHAVVYTVLASDTTNAILAASVAAAINADPTASALVVATAPSAVITLTAVTAGTVGNAITLTCAKSSASGTYVASGATLSGGTGALPTWNWVRN